MATAPVGVVATAASVAALHPRLTRSGMLDAQASIRTQSIIICFSFFSKLHNGACGTVGGWTLKSQRFTEISAFLLACICFFLLRSAVGSGVVFEGFPTLQCSGS